MKFNNKKEFKNLNINQKNIVKKVYKIYNKFTKMKMKFQKLKS